METKEIPQIKIQEVPKDFSNAQMRLQNIHLQDGRDISVQAFSVDGKNWFFNNKGEWIPIIEE